MKHLRKMLLLAISAAMMGIFVAPSIAQAAPLWYLNGEQLGNFEEEKEGETVYNELSVKGEGTLSFRYGSAPGAFYTTNCSVNVGGSVGNDIQEAFSTGTFFTVDAISNNGVCGSLYMPGYQQTPCPLTRMTAGALSIGQGESPQGWSSISEKNGQYSVGASYVGFETESLQTVCNWQVKGYASSAEWSNADHAFKFTASSINGEEPWTITGTIPIEPVEGGVLTVK
jgi:hypothetical protein